MVSTLSTINLLPHQEQCVLHMINCEDRYNSVINFSTMGTGKTIETIKLMLDRPKRNNLIVCPRNIINQWQKELNKFTPFTTHIYDRKSTMYQLQNNNIVIATYEMLYHRGKTDLKSILHNIQYDRVIFDECHMIKNRYTKRHKSSTLLNSKNFILLTGTPISCSINQNQEFKSYCDILNVTSQVFKQLYIRKTMQDVDNLPTITYHNISIILSTQHLNILEQLGYNIRCKEDNFDWFEHIEEKFNDLGLQELYNQLIQQNNGLVKFNRKKYLLSNPNMLLNYFNKNLGSNIMNYEKINQFNHEHIEKLNTIHSIVKKNHRYIIVTNYVNENQIIYEQLKKRKFYVKQINGSVKQDIRDDIIKSSQFSKADIILGLGKKYITHDIIDTIYNTHLRTDIIIGSCKCLSTGLNLQHFNNLIICTPPSLINYAQVQARIVRIGSKYKNVNIYNLYYKDTIEEKTYCQHLEKIKKYETLDDMIKNYSK
tara:strand:+ start:1260 stop:2711 length:1452 start_codon:yes stop_codon:yes gene_type:complete